MRLHFIVGATEIVEITKITSGLNPSGIDRVAEELLVELRVILAEYASSRRRSKIGEQDDGRVRTGQDVVEAVRCVRRLPAIHSSDSNSDTRKILTHRYS